MLTTTYRKRPVREPSNQAGSIHEQWANEEPILCPDCGDAEVSSEGEPCAECYAERPKCGVCLEHPAELRGHLAGYCSIECRDADDDAHPYDTREESRLER